MSDQPAATNEHDVAAAEAQAEAAVAIAEVQAESAETIAETQAEAIADRSEDEWQQRLNSLTASLEDERQLRETELSALRTETETRLREISDLIQSRLPEPPNPENPPPEEAAAEGHASEPEPPQEPAPEPPPPSPPRRAHRWI